MTWMVVANVLLTLAALAPRARRSDCSCRKRRPVSDAASDSVATRCRCDRAASPWLTAADDLARFVRQWRFGRSRADRSTSTQSGIGVLLSALPITWFAALLIAVLAAARAASDGATSWSTSGGDDRTSSDHHLRDDADGCLHCSISVDVQAHRGHPTAGHDGSAAPERRHLQQLLGVLRPRCTATRRDRRRSDFVRGVVSTRASRRSRCLCVWLLVQRCTDSNRVAHVATLVYLLTNWVGQNYFAPQAFGTIFGLSTLALCFSWFATPQLVAWSRGQTFDPTNGPARFAAESIEVTVASPIR